MIYISTNKTEYSGIAYFVPEHWEQSRTVNPFMDGVGKQIASCEGIILEIGAGPGGGYMPYILKPNPDATIIISDLSHF